MGRRENAIPDPQSPEGQVATFLRGCRKAAGTPTYEVLEQRTDYSNSVLSQAATGLTLPTCDVVIAYVRGCGGDVDEAVRIWRAAVAQSCGTERAADPSRVHTPAELVGELQMLAHRHGLRRPAEIHAAMARVGIRISRATFYRGWSQKQRVMQARILVGILAACQVTADTGTYPDWLAAHDRAERATVHTDNPPEPPGGLPPPDPATATPIPGQSPVTSPLPDTPRHLGSSADQLTPPHTDDRHRVPAHLPPGYAASPSPRPTIHSPVSEPNVDLGVRKEPTGETPAKSANAASGRHRYLAVRDHEDTLSYRSARQLKELQRLRQGRGVHRVDLDAYVGPYVRELCAIHDSDGPAVIRDKIVHRLDELISNLPEDLRQVVRTALGMNPEAQLPFLSDRVAWLAAREQRESRTVIRRIDSALNMIIEAGIKRAGAAPPQPAAEWHVRQFDAFLRMDGPTPVCHEVRTIVANKDGLDRIPWSISVPAGREGAPADLDIAVQRGVVIAGRQKVSARRYLLDLELPQPLRAGQTHTFAIEIRIPRGQTMRPTYMFWPERRCEQFNLVIRYGVDSLPEQVWKVDAAFHRDTDDLEPKTDTLEISNIGEVHASFTELRQSHGYGIQWLSPSNPAHGYAAEPH